MNFDLLKRLTETPGVPGREERIRQLIAAETAELFDELRTDDLGNLIGRRAGGDGGRRVMLACHMDEIGFYVSHIDDKGFVRVNPVGGFDTRNLHARKVLVQGRQDLLGTLHPAGKPVHLASAEDKKKVYELSDFYIDLYRPAEQVKELVALGDPVTLVQTTERVGPAIVGKAMDNRVASYVAIEALRQLGQTRGAEVHYVATTQEEVGVRGAGPAAFGIEPDVAIALDVTLACDTPGNSPDQYISTLGGGVAIKIMDGYSISDRGLVDEMVTLAKRKKIPYQLEILPRGGTDAGPIQRTRTGYRTITLSVPCRYVHTVTETVHPDDLQAAVDLLAAWLAQ